MAKVFVSYAHADNPQLVPNEPGWVTRFASRLKAEVARKLTGPHDVLWIDHRLNPQKEVNTALVEEVAAADCFIAVLSPSYLHSKWCREEMDGFVRRFGGAANRVFLVEIVPTAREDWPRAVRGITELRFWTHELEERAPKTFGWPEAHPTDSAHRPYWDGLNELSHLVADQLRALTLPAPVDDLPRRRVWIAQPTEPVRDLWDRLASAVRQRKWQVLPASSRAYEHDSRDKFYSALNADLSQADVFVQLLGPDPGSRPEWSRLSYTILQANAARDSSNSRGVSRWIWRAPEVRLDSVDGAEYLNLLTGATAGSFVEFQKQVLADPPVIVTPVDRQQQSAASGLLPSRLNICVNADAPDRRLGEHILELLFDLGVDVTLAPEHDPSQSATQWRLDYETLLNETQGLVIVYGSSPATWVQAQVQAARKLLAPIRRGTWGALLEGPPGDQPDHGVRSHNLMRINCRHAITSEPLAQFLDVLRGGAPAGSSNA